jgi:hypothetical protein
MAHHAGGRVDAAGQGGGPRQIFRGGDRALDQSNFQQGGYQDPRNGCSQGFQGNFNNQSFNNHGNFNNQANYNNQGNFNKFNEFQGGGRSGGYGEFHPGVGGNDFFWSRQW